MPAVPTCSVCNKEKDADTEIMRCSRCHDRLYCGKACQVSDWKTHKLDCKVKPTPQWYDKHRKCQDGSFHEGKLELITWPCELEETGWGHCTPEESDDLRKKLEVEYGGDEVKFFAYWPQGFRWTCCGTDAGMDWGCDHHGTGSRPCTCDFCRMGKPLPDSIYKEKTASRIGLNLRRGPDSRSFNRGIAATAAAGRAMMGLQM